jgi:hypothetical protein
MTCPSERLLIASALGELSPNDAVAIGEHLKTCERCAASTREHAELAVLLRADSVSAASDVPFVQRVMNECAFLPSRAPRAPLHRRSWVYGLAAMAAVACLWLTRPASHRGLDVVAARGSSGRDVALVTPDVLLLLDKTLLPIAHAELGPGDGFVVRYWNSSDDPVYLAVFAIDAQQSVHWIYPAYLDVSQNPTSIRLERVVEGKVMGEAVEPDRPAVGPMRVVALLTSEPLNVHQVETQLAHRGEKLSESFPKARVHEWSCTWNAR